MAVNDHHYRYSVQVIKVACRCAGAGCVGTRLGSAPHLGLPVEIQDTPETPYNTRSKGTIKQPLPSFTIGCYYVGMLTGSLGPSKCYIPSTYFIRPSYLMRNDAFMTHDSSAMTISNLSYPACNLLVLLGYKRQNFAMAA